jgi:hypothetical protein
MGAWAMRGFAESRLSVLTDEVKSGSTFYVLPVTDCGVMPQLAKLGLGYTPAAHPMGTFERYGDFMLAPVQLLSASRQNLWRLTLIRILVLAAQAGSVGLAYKSDALPLPWLELSVTLGIALILCLLTALRLRGPWPVTEQEYAIQLACDLIIHSTLLYYAGGSTNPFVSYYLVPLTIAAAILPWLYTITLSGLALGGYTFLLVWSHPLELPVGSLLG